jgi:hypothetical protein
MHRCSLLFYAFTTGLLQAQTTVYDGRPAVVLSNDKIALTVATNGGALVNLVLQNDASRLSPYWRTRGHFLCLDGFGTPSKEEAAAGLPMHGEANRQNFEIVSLGRSGPISSLKLSAKLPLAQEAVTRHVQVNDGENVFYVETEVENLLAFDRPVSWAEHATIGPPFLEKGGVVVDMPGVQCRVRPEKPHNLPNRLIFERDFTWPMAPAVDGGTADLRLTPERNNLDLASCVMDPTQELAFATALHLGKHLLFGYAFRRAEYPWVMSWMNFTGNDQAARGMEFSTQPFDVSHRETVDANSMFGTPTFRWLPAKSKIRSRFLVFYTRVPVGMTRVDSVTLLDRRLVIEDRKSGERVALTVASSL